MKLLVLLQIGLLVVCVKKYESFYFPVFFRNTFKIVLECVKGKNKTSLVINISLNQINPLVIRGAGVNLVNSKSYIVSVLCSYMTLLQKQVSKHKGLNEIYAKFLSSPN